MKKSLILPIALALFFGMLLSYPFSVSSGVLIFLENDFQMTSLSKSMLVSLVVVGAILGILFGGEVADRFGRKKAILLSALFLALGSFSSAFSHSFIELLLFRFITGVGVGITSMCIPIYLAEMAEPEYRGKMVSVFQVSITLGIFLSYMINYFLISSHNWRMALGLCGFVAVLGFFTTIISPESKVWLASKIEKNLNTRDLNEAKTRTKIFFQASFKKALILGVSISVFQQITGINAIIFYAPEIFMRAGITDLKGNLFVTLLMGLFNVLTALFTMTRIDGWGRRKLLLLGIPGMVVSLLMLGFFANSKLFSVFGLFLYILSFGISLGPVAWVMIAEIYPFEIRARAVSLTLFMNWIGSLLVSFLFLFMIDWLGVGGAFHVFSIISILAFAFVYFKVPETKGKSLEDINAFFET
jgi:SP family galactose:H+ symporter-like MFS transporter